LLDTSLYTDNKIIAPMMLSKKIITMKKLILSLVLMAVTTSYSQELNLPVFTQYLADNPFILSPAYAGIGDNLRIRANGLTQWVGIVPVLVYRCTMTAMVIQDKPVLKFPLRTTLF
jgi:hypothetical protein